MRINLLFILAFFTTVISSCKHEQVPDLSFVEVIYCTPDNPANCLPLEITNTSEGLRAKYIGASSDQVLTLKPHYEVDKTGDSTIVLDEYLDGENNDKYIFKDNQTDIYDKVYRAIKYINGKDTISFCGSMISKGDVFIDIRDFSGSINKIINHDDNDPDGHGSERRDLNLLHLLHSNPMTFTESFEGIEDISAITSKDGMFRAYFVNCWSGGNGASASYRMIPIQYKTDYGILTLNDISRMLYNQLKEFNGANFPIETSLDILQATLKGKTYYMIEVAYYDPQPAPFVYGRDDYYKTNALTLFAYSIENKKLTPAKIFGGKSMIELVNMDGDENIHFKYDDKTKELQVPIVNPKNHAFTGKHKIMKI